MAMKGKAYRIGNVVWAPFANSGRDRLSPQARARLEQLRAKMRQGITLAPNERPLLKFLEDCESGREPTRRRD